MKRTFSSCSSYIFRQMILCIPLLNFQQLHLQMQKNSNVSSDWHSKVKSLRYFCYHFHSHHLDLTSNTFSSFFCAVSMRIACMPYNVSFECKRDDHMISCLCKILRVASTLSSYLYLSQLNPHSLVSIQSCISCQSRGLQGMVEEN